MKRKITDFARGLKWGDRGANGFSGSINGGFARSAPRAANMMRAHALSHGIPLEKIEATLSDCDAESPEPDTVDYDLPPHAEKEIYEWFDRMIKNPAEKPTDRQRSLIKDSITGEKGFAG